MIRNEKEMKREGIEAIISWRGRSINRDRRTATRAIQPNSTPMVFFFFLKRLPKYPFADSHRPGSTVRKSLRIALANIISDGCRVTEAVATTRAETPGVKRWNDPPSVSP